MDKILTSGDPLSCADYCIYDSGTTCKFCERFHNTELFKIAKSVEPTYPQVLCGCGEGWSDERCNKLTQLIGDGEHHCIFDYEKI